MINELTFQLNSKEVKEQHYPIQLSVSDATKIVDLLKEEPRVLSLEEATEGECWFEYINGSCGNADVYMKDNKTAIIYRANRRSVQVQITDYMKKWRCWSYRPTNEQRKAVKWGE